MNRAALYPLALSLLLSSCEKTGVNALPEATQTGRNTMGCLLDGTPWLPYRNAALPGSISLRPPVLAYWRVHDRGRVSLDLYFSRDRQPGRYISSVSLYAPAVTGPATLALNQRRRTVPEPPNGSFSNADETPDLTYFTGPAATGELVITCFDTTARVVSGTFAFTGLADDASGRTVALSQGRFDVKLERR